MGRTYGLSAGAATRVRQTAVSGTQSAGFAAGRAQVVTQKKRPGGTGPVNIPGGAGLGIRRRDNGAGRCRTSCTVMSRPGLDERAATKWRLGRLKEPGAHPTRRSGITLRR